MTIVTNKIGRFRRLTQNPIVLKELRSRMRGRRAFTVLTLYLVIMSALIAVLYSTFWSSFRFRVPSANDQRQLGQLLFAIVTGVQVFVVCLMAPAFTAPAITGEKERQTYDVLRTTPLKPTNIIHGKLISALSYVLLLIVAALPVQSLAFLFGGIDWVEVVVSQVMLLVSAVFYTLIGLFYSARMKSTIAATVATFATCITILIGIPLFYALITTIYNAIAYAGPSSGPPAFDYEELFAYIGIPIFSFNLPASMIISEGMLLDQNVLWYSTTRPYSAAKVLQLSPWWINIILTTLLSLILYVATVRKMRQTPNK